MNMLLTKEEQERYLAIKEETKARVVKLTVSDSYLIKIDEQVLQLRTTLSKLVHGLENGRYDLAIRLDQSLEPEMIHLFKLINDLALSFPESKTAIITSNIENLVSLPIQTYTQDNLSTDNDMGLDDYEDEVEEWDGQN